MLQNNQKLLPSKVSSRLVIHHECKHCNKWFRPGDVEVNHIKTVGALTWENLGEFVENLFHVKETDLEILCKPCHSIVTYSERSGMSMEDAKIEKMVINFTKNSAAVQKTKLRSKGIEPGATAGIRRSQARAYISSILKGES
jgi:5-methylcytosine-specific restriction endonuclease McrA